MVGRMGNPPNPWRTMGPPEYADCGTPFDASLGPPKGEGACAVPRHTPQRADATADTAAPIPCDAPVVPRAAIAFSTAVTTS